MSLQSIILRTLFDRTKSIMTRKVYSFHVRFYMQVDKSENTRWQTT